MGSTEHLIFFSVPGLRARDVDKSLAPTLFEWSKRGVLAEIEPTFPCVTSCVQASMLTGLPPSGHGVIANGFFDRRRAAVEFWVAGNEVIAGRQIWDVIRSQRPGLTSAVWHAQNIKGAGTDFIVTPAPVHHPDGSTSLWCYSKPDGLYQRILGDLGHFPLQHYWGPFANIESTRWILRGAQWLIDRHDPNYHWIYLPHLDYASQKYGPDGPESRKALSELDSALAEFADAVMRRPAGRDVVFLAAGEYALTDVSNVAFPNRILREAGLLNVQIVDEREQLDIASSRAFAMVDHQCAHVFVRDAAPGVLEECAELFRSVPGVAGVYCGIERESIGMLHERSGDIILVSDDNCWFAYYWWLEDRAAPQFARTVNIHRKPGYDPVELFLDPATKTIPLDAELVRGSHGVPARASRHRTALLSSSPAGAVQKGAVYSGTGVNAIALSILGISLPDGP